MGIINKFKDVLSSTKNFQYLNNLINSGKMEVSFNNDIKRTEKESKNYSLYRNKGIFIGVSDITIDGNGHTIHADMLDNVLSVGGKNVTLKNIIFDRGNCAIYNYGELNLINCKFTSNSAQSGGAIYNSGKLTLTNCEFIRNFAVKGGAIYNEGEIIVNDVLFKDNDFKYGEANGGAIYNDSLASISNCQFIGNKSKYSGGAIYNNGELKISDSLFCDNQSREADGGGAIYNLGDLELLNSEFKRNSARFATAIYNGGKLNCKKNIFSDSHDPIFNMGTLNIENTECTDNSGVIGNSGNLYIKNSTFNENSISVIENKDNGKIELVDSKFLRNKSKEGTIYNEGINLHIDDSLFLENDGRAIHNKTILTVENSEFKHNRSQESGGAIFNERYQEFGVNGAVYSQKENVLKIQNTLFVDNASPIGEVISNLNGYVKVNGCEFINHKEDAEIIFNSDKFEIENSVFKDNSSKSIITNWENGELDIFDGKFLDNNLSKSAIHNMGEYASISNSLFENNASDLKNAGSIFNETKLKLKKVSINDDNISVFNEGAIFLNGLNILVDGPGNVIGEDIPKDNFDFYYLDNLIHSSPSMEIILEHDISLEYYEHDFYDGGIDLDVDNLVIDGCGKTISGNNLSRIFLISGKNIVLKNIIFKDGFLQEDYNNEMVGGAALRITSFSSLTIENCTFRFNHCGKNGGAILNFGLLSLSNSKFEDNLAKNGGAIFNQSKTPFKIDNIVFSNNMAESGGGALFNANDDITISNCRFLNNKAKIRGGGFRNTSYSFTQDGTVQIESSEFEGNVALIQGGAIFNIGDEVELKNMIFRNNAANGHGGAVCNTGTKLIVSDSLFENNMANVLEDYLTDTSDEINVNVVNKLTNLHVMDFKFTSNQVMRRMECNGGAINNLGDAVKIRNTKFLNNKSKNAGGAIFHDKGNILDIADSCFFDNQSPYGGSIYNDNTISVKLTNCICEENNPNDVSDE